MLKKEKILLYLILLLAFLFRLPSFFQPHIENDEIIYQTLINKNTFRLKDYTLQETEILPRLPLEIYDSALFFHPPLFVFSASLIQKTIGKNFLILLPIVSSLSTVWLIYKIGRVNSDVNQALMAAAIFSLCPINLFVSSKIWLDSFLTFLITLSFYLAFKAKKPRDYFFSGLFFALALLTKYSAIFILFSVTLIFWQKKAKRTKVLAGLISFSLPLVLVLPWFVYQYQTLGIFFKNTKPSLESLNMFPFLQKVSQRPFYFYLSQLIILFPLYFLPLLKLFNLKFVKKTWFF